jgi:hypothetical protein
VKVRYREAPKVVMTACGRSKLSEVVMPASGVASEKIFGAVFDSVLVRVGGPGAYVGIVQWALV